MAHSFIVKHGHSKIHKFIFKFINNLHIAVNAFYCKLRLALTYEILANPVTNNILKIKFSIRYSVEKHIILCCVAKGADMLYTIVLSRHIIVH